MSAMMDAKTAAFAQAARVRASRPLSPILIGGILRFLDLGVITVTGIGAYLAYVYPGGGAFDSQYVGSIAVAVLLSAAALQWFGAYGGDYVFARSLRADRTILAWAVTFAVLLTLAFALKVSDQYSRLWAGTWFVAAAGILTLGRLIAARYIGDLARLGRFAARAVIVGAGEQGKRLAEHLRKYGDTRGRVVGFIDDRLNRVPPTVAGIPVLGDTSALVEMIRRDQVDEVYVALPWSAEARQRDLILELATTPIPIHLAPDLVGFGFAGRRFAEVAQLPVLNVFDRPISGWSQVAKSIEDRLLASLLLLFLAPFMVLIAISIKLDTRGPVFFRQLRQGFNNSLFRVWKFRTMHGDDEQTGDLVQATKGDARVTRVGRFLRRTSLDELPQLFNVLTGEMSLVGPRPHALGTKSEGREFSDVVVRYAARHKVKPGITGWAQINGMRGETDTVDKIQGRVAHDLFYIDNWSIRLDLVILLKTALVLLTDKSAY